MRPLAEFPQQIAASIELLFADIDDTLTSDGRLTDQAFSALWEAHRAGLSVVPVTGRPAGWCDHIARMWPVAAVVGENGALAYGLRDGVMHRIYSERPEGSAERLRAIEAEIIARVPGCKVSADQPFRLYDLAIDFCEEVTPLTPGQVDEIAAVFRRHGATAKISSIHVNGWFGDFDKLTMCCRCVDELLGLPLSKHRTVFVGDSPNDVPMFGYFPNAVGVANVNQWVKKMDRLPAYVTRAPGGYGFAEVVAHLLAERP